MGFFHFTLYLALDFPFVGGGAPAVAIVLDGLLDDGRERTALKPLVML